MKRLGQILAIIATIAGALMWVQILPVLVSIALNL